MHRLTLLILVVFLYACNEGNKSKTENQQDEYKLTARFNSFGTTVEVLFWNTKDPISETQKKNYDGFVAKQDLLTPEILKKIFDFYKSSYTDYKRGWTMPSGISDKELEKYLPTPSTPEDLKPFITPAIVHIQNKQDCKEGTIGIEFECTWDIKSGLGVAIKNWKVVEVSVAEVAYFLP